ncbi:MAG TPA: phosphatase PAP2 family protein [Gemmatimonadales bacterium]|nr:phosphatase PAP2 family protein [Gemmatimonadales bacterium]
MAQLNGARRFAPIEIATLLYTAVTTVAAFVFIRGDLVTLGWLLVAHALIVCLVLLAPRARESGAVGRFAADWYAFLIMGALYAEVGVMNLDFGYDHDRTIQRLEQWVFGAQVSYEWIRVMPNPVLSWVLHFCYLVYYGMLVAAPLGLWLSGRRDGTRHTIFAVSTTFYLCYAIFLFFPVAGPRYAFPLADNAATRIPLAQFAQWLLDKGDSWGAAFPSSHVAAAVVATVCALRYWRTLGLSLAPFAIGLVLSVVYGQFHYGVDALSGLLVAGGILYSVRTRAPGTAPRAVGLHRPSETESPPLRL